VASLVLATFFSNPPRIPMIRRKFVLPALFLAGSALISACSMQGREVPLEISGVILTGTIKYGNAVVPNAMVIVKRPGPSGPNSSSIATANDDGVYRVENCPMGEVMIGVNTDAAKGMMMGRAMAGTDPTKSGSKALSVPKVTDVPKKFFNPDESGIKTTLQKGVNNFDIIIPKS
jgi:hypothetical protein